MFKLECFVDDKQLARAMHGLDGLVVDLKVVPVRNAAVKNGKLKSTAAASTYDAIHDYVEKNKLSQISARQLKEVLGASGFSGHSTAIVNAVKAKLLRHGKERGQYVVVKSKEAEHG